MLNNLNIVKDCWWAMPSGSTYMIDENDTLSSEDHGLYKSFNATDTEFVRSSNSGEINYYGRLDSNNLDVTHIAATIRAECVPEGSAILYVNSLNVGSIAVSGIDDYYANYELTNEQKARIFSGRILSNYDYFGISVDSSDAVDVEFKTPELWLRADQDVYPHIDTDVYPAVTGSGTIANGDPVAAWVDQGSNAYMLEQDYGDEYKPIYFATALNGQPAIRFHNPSGMFMHYNFVGGSNAPLSSESGEIFAVFQVENYPASASYLFEQSDNSATRDVYSRFGFKLNDDEAHWAWRAGAGTASYSTSSYNYPIESGVIKCVSAKSNDKLHSFTVDGSGISAAPAQQGQWWWSTSAYLGNSNAHIAVGNTWDGNNPLNADYGFDGYIAEILVYESPLTSVERLGVYDYISDKYDVTPAPLHPVMKLYNAEIAYSGNVTWDNHQAGLPNVGTYKYYPTSIAEVGDVAWSGSHADINMGVDDSNVDDLYIQNENIGSYNSFWTDSEAMPSGCLSIRFSPSVVTSILPIVPDTYGTYDGTAVNLANSDVSSDTPAVLDSAQSLRTWSDYPDEGYVTVNSGCSNFGTSDFSAMFWYKWGDDGLSDGYVVMMGDKPVAALDDPNWHIELDLSYAPYAYMAFPYSTAYADITSPDVLLDHDWHHIAMTADRSGFMRLYVDGIEKGTADISTHAAVSIDNDGYFHIGEVVTYSGDDPNEFYFDDVRLYDEVVGSGDVFDIANGTAVATTPVTRWTFDDIVSPDSIKPLTQITRAQMLLRMSFPPSGQGDNVRDTFEINGYNARYKNHDHREEMAYVDSSQEGVFPGFGYFLYGAGDMIEQSGFKTYTTELNFLDPLQPSGAYSSTRHANADMLANMDFHLIGIPSGTQISAAELTVQYIPNNTLSLYTAGSVYRCAASSTVDAGTSQSYTYGDGGWHHRGWRLRGPTVIEEDVFTNFYTFDEGAGNTRTYPETTKAYYFPSGDEDLTVYADYVKLSPKGTVGDTADVTPYLVDPQRREYYRNPIDTHDLTPSYELPTLRDTTHTQPSYYRNMLYHSESLGFFDGDLDAVDENSINWASVSQVHYGDRMGLGPSCTLYFMLYRDYGFQSYGRFFHRGRVENEGINNYEIYGDLEMDRVRFTVRSVSNQNQKVEVEIDRNTVEPILVWFECDYGSTGNYTTLTLSVHDDITNYFNTSWKRATTTFAGLRKQYTEQTTVATRPDGTTYTTTYGGPRTVLGTLEQLTFFEQLSRKIYLHRSSICEFAYHGTNSIELDWDTSNSDTYLGYDVSQEKDKHFFKTRLCTNQYVQPNPSGIQWIVPVGTGEAQWSTTYNINDWTQNSLAHSLYNPISTAGTNNVVAPSAIYIDMSAAHNTNHPSGVTVLVDLEFDSGTTDKWKVASAEFNIPSGGSVYLQYEPIDFQAAISKHINMDEGPIRYTDVENINVRVTTKYPTIGEDEYYGNFTIHSLNVSFDSYCVAATGLADLDLYTHGTAATLGSAADTSLDLFIEGKVTIDPPDPGDGTQNLDLYIKGFPHVASGDIMPLYIKGKQPTDPNVGADGTAFIPLYIEGLDPPNASGSFDLFVWGTTNPAIREFADFYIKSDIDPRYALPLYIGGDDESIASNSGINLFTAGHWPSGDAMDMYINGVSTPSNTLNLYTASVLSANSGLNMYIHGSGAPVNKRIDFYTHGF